MPKMSKYNVSSIFLGPLAMWWKLSSVAFLLLWSSLSSSSSSLFADAFNPVVQNERIGWTQQQSSSLSSTTTMSLDYRHSFGNQYSIWKPITTTTLGTKTTSKPFKRHPTMGSRLYMVEQMSTSVLEDPAKLTSAANSTVDNITSSPSNDIAVQDMNTLGATSSIADAEYKRGLITIGFITLLFASNSPALHAAFSSTDNPPPVLLLNAAVSAVALVGLLLGGESLESNTPLPSTLKRQNADSIDSNSSSNRSDEKTLQLQQEQKRRDEQAIAFKGGCELGLWKFLGTTANLYGLALTTASHGALLIQLTTLIVPVVQGIQGVPIPDRIKFSVVLALAGVICFTQDPMGTSPSALGDALCVVAAGFYATYDLRLFVWGKRVAPRRLITTKIGTQALLSLALLAVGFGDMATGGAATIGSAWQESIEYIHSLNDFNDFSMILPVVLWSGVAVNAVAPFLQVGGQQAVGPTRCQTIYASQPLWAAILSFCFLGETIGYQGLLGGSAFLIALFLAATAEAPDPNCGVQNCEV